jgi:hypothetical protein
LNRSGMTTKRKNLRQQQDTKSQTDSTPKICNISS